MEPFENPMFEEPTILSKFRGNTLLKKPGEQIAWTPELVAEWLRCADDPLYFINKYCKIVHVDKGLIPFDMRDYQEDMVLKMHTNRNCIFNCSRQSGKTTSVVGYVLYYAIFNPMKVIGIFANKGDISRKILGQIRLAYTYLPKWLQQGVVEFNKGSIELENGSKIIATSTASDAGRSYAYSLIVLDELAFIENWEEFSGSVLPTISSGETTKIVMVSTPRGLNHFYKILTDAKEGRNDYAWIEVPWYKVPGRDEKWGAMALRDFCHGDQQKFDQEFNIEFLGSSGTLIAGWKLKQLSAKTPIADHVGLKQYELPKDGRRYCIVVDVSRGKGLDYHAFQVIDVTEMPYKQVAVFRNNMMTPLDYTAIVYEAAKQYKEAMVLVETRDIGGQVADHLYDDLEYENLVFTESAGARGKRISLGMGKGTERGVMTSQTVKRIGCSILKLLIEGDKLIIQDFETINELSTFSKKGSSYEAERGAHDDLTMGLVLFAWLSDQQYFRELTEIYTLGHLREKTDDELMGDLIPFGFIDEVEEAEAELYRPYHPDHYGLPDREFGGGW